METGKVVIDNTAERLAADADVREFYLGLGQEGGQQELPRAEALQAPQALAVVRRR